MLVLGGVVPDFPQSTTLPVQFHVCVLHYTKGLLGLLGDIVGAIPMVVHASQVVELDLVEGSIFHEIFLHLVDVDSVLEPVEALLHFLETFEMFLDFVFDIVLIVIFVLHVGPQLVIHTREDRL